MMYKVVCEGLLNQLETEVNVLLKQGFKPIGVLFKIEGRYIQAMYKEVL